MPSNISRREIWRKWKAKDEIQIQKKKENKAKKKEKKIGENLKKNADLEYYEKITIELQYTFNIYSEA